MIRFLMMMMAALGMLVAAPAIAATAAPPASAENGVAIRGYDPVAFFTLGRPQEGSAEHAFVYEGASWRFASAENLAKFKATLPAMRRSSAVTARGP